MIKRNNVDTPIEMCGVRIVGSKTTYSSQANLGATKFITVDSEGYFYIVNLDGKVFKDIP